MLPEIVSFKKRYLQRLAEYKFLFDENSSCCKIYQLWAEILALTFGRVKNLSALWQLSEETCSRFKALFPMVVIVTVQELLENDLSAVVIVEGTQEDVIFPDLIEVPIFELFPIKNQSVPVGTVVRISNAIDQCRFFFLNLWYPWDNTEDVSVGEWCAKHLCNRLKLQCDIIEGVIERAAAQHIKHLMTEALQVADALEGAEEEISDASRAKLNLVKNLCRKKEIKLKLSLYEDPDLRETMIKYLTEQEVEHTEGVAIVVLRGTLNDAINDLEMAKRHIQKNDQVNIFSETKHALDSCSTVLLSPGIHKISNLGKLSHGGALKGLGEASETIISPKEMTPAPYLFLTSYKCVLFENITLVRNEGVQFTVSSGVMLFKRCILRGSESKAACGVVVMPGCRVELEDCDLSQLNTAVTVRENATALITSCHIHNCEQGIKVMDNATATLEKVEVTSCSGAGIVVQTSEMGEDVAGSVDLLDHLGSDKWFVSHNGSIFHDNTINVVIKHVPIECFID